MLGFYGRIITIDLGLQAFSIENLSDDIYSRYLGGKGLPTYFLLERNPKGVDPLPGPGQPYDRRHRSILPEPPVGRKPLWRVHQISPDRSIR